MEETVTLMLRSHHLAEPEPVEVPRRIGAVKLGELLGQGAGGAVFSGFDEALNRRVAVKLLHRAAQAGDAAATAELVDGIRAAAAIKHVNIVSIYAVEETGGMPVIVMEFVDGVSMRELVKRTGALDLPLALYIMRQVLAGVDVLHQANVVHRDLKPANILFDRDGVGRVCDFGLALRFDSQLWKAGVGQVGGSPLYMAPEMFDGHVSPHGDVYALGVMLFELLCGQTPFVGETISDLQVSHGNSPPPIELLETALAPEGLCEVVRRALHKQRFMRYKTAGHFLRALDDFRPSAPSDDVLRRRVAAGVIGGANAAATAGDMLSIPDRTTFDLLARRAEAKRSKKTD